MDPLSMTAGIVAVVGAGGAIGKGLAKILALRHAPQILLALNNEITDLQCVVQDIDDLLRPCSGSTNFTPPTSLYRALEKSRQSLAELESLVYYELTSIRGKRNEAEMDKSVWLRAEHKAQNLKDEIRDDRTRLASALSLLASSCLIDTTAQVQRLCFSVDSLEIRVGDPNQALIDQRHDGMGMQDQPTEMARGEEENVQNTVQDLEANAVSMSVSHPPTQSRVQDNANPASSLIPVEARTHSRKLELFKNSCTPSCNCTCHQRQRFRSPNFLSEFLGRLLIGYTAKPWAKRKCDNSHCRDHSTRITYIFPSWFWERAISVSVESALTQGPELCLRVMRTQPRSADIFRSIRSGHCFLQRVLAEGRGSIYDVDPEGHTGLYYAANEWHLECVETLLHAGADKYHEGNDGSSPYHLVWERILAKRDSFSPEALNSWLKIFGDQSRLEEMGFTRLHKAYLGISAENFEEILALTPRCQIDQVDTGGRTLLYWAAVRGDQETLNKLLSCGSNPSISDNSGFTPLHRSQLSGRPSVISALLVAKADVNAKSAFGDTALGIAATRYDGHVNMRTLVDYIADVESRDENGLTPLSRAATFGSQHNVRFLLEEGAIINAVDDNGFTPADNAITYNNHAALELLLDYCDQEIFSGTIFSERFLESAAYWADMETLEILCSRDIKPCVDGRTALDDAVWRRDSNEEWSNSALSPRDDDPLEWYAAFERFMASIVEPQRRIDNEDASEDEGELEESSEAGMSEATADPSDAGEVWEDAPESS